MKQKKNFWGKGKYRFIACTMVMIFIMVSLPMDNSLFHILATSDTEERLEEAERERDQKEAELEEAQARLQSTQNTLAGLQGERNTYQGQMEILNSELQMIADKLDVLERQMELKQMDIDQTTENLQAAIEVRENQYESMKRRIQFLYEKGTDGYLEIIMSAQTFGEFLNYAEYVTQMHLYDRQMLSEYVQLQEDIALEQENLQAQMEELEQLQADAIAEQERVNGLIQNTANSLAATLDSLNDAQAVADAYEEECDQRAAEAAAANAEYERIRAQYEEELRLSRLAAQSEWRDLSQISFEEGDRYLLANLIYCEAGAEPYEGKVAVGAVVMNRVKSTVFPNTITGVIYQNKQFSPVLDGHLALALAQDRATPECYQAADEAMAGLTNVGNCVFFRTPIEGLTGISIGGHIFY